MEDAHDAVNFFCGPPGEDTMSRKLWGAAAIGAAINRNPKQTYHLLNKGLIRSARRIGERWVVDEDELQREFSAPAQPTLHPNCLRVVRCSTRGGHASHERIRAACD